MSQLSPDDRAAFDRLVRIIELDLQGGDPPERLAELDEGDYYEAQREQAKMERILARRLMEHNRDGFLAEVARCTNEDVRAILSDMATGKYRPLWEEEERN